MTVTVKLDSEDIENIAQRVAILMKHGEQQPAQSEQPSNYMTREDYATQMSLSPQTVSRLYDKGKLTGKKVGRRLYIYVGQQMLEPRVQNQEQ